MSDAIAIHRAYESGDLVALKAALGDPPDFPNCRGPRGAGVSAVYWASSSTAKARLFTSSAMKAVSRVSMLSVPEW